jgi:WD40 repeat protein
VAFAPDGSLIASAGHGRQVRLWDVATGQDVGTLIGSSESGYSNIAFAPSGSVLAVAGVGVDLWAVSAPA